MPLLRNPMTRDSFILCFENIETTSADGRTIPTGPFPPRCECPIMNGMCYTNACRLRRGMIECVACHPTLCGNSAFLHRSYLTHPCFEIFQKSMS